MILTCPSCSSRYQVDAVAFQEKPRKVRCANCGHRWKASAPPEEANVTDIELAPPSANQQEERVRAAVTPKSVRRPARAEAKRSGSPVGWLLALGAVVLLFVSVVIGRNGIVGKFPATAAVYQSVGLQVEQDFGLEFKDVTLDWQREGGAFVLVVEGEIVNLSDTDQPIPPVRMAILDSEGRELQHEYFDVGESEIEAGNRVNFSGRMVDPIDKGENFRLTFEQDS